ncbi:MAG: hypothetical protein ACRDLA_04190, partial [Thermoleophilaceae bacterium]
MPDVAAASIKLEGCTSASLDSYLRGLGVVRLAARHARSARFSWSDDGCLLLAAGDLSVLIEELVQRATHEGAELTEPIASPWRGSRSSGPFEELRGEVDESLLAWFDACSVARFEGAEAKRVNNPLLGQGGGFGRAEIEPALAEALERLAALHEQPDVLLRGLEGTLLGRPIDRRVARRLGVAKKVLGAYQSGRATGPGGSRRDVDPSGQSARTSAWDLVLALEGVRALRGSNTRRSGGGRVQASFPLLVRSRAIDVSGGPRDDDGRTYEFLAPMWSAPARPAAILHLLGAFRLRVGGRPAGDTLDALVSHATARAVEVGFDRLVRFALVAPSDPRYQYAVRRGTSTARGSRAAAVIAEELLPFLHRAGGWSPDEHVSAGLRRARRRVDDLVVAASRDEDTNAVIDLLGALVELEQRLARRTGPPRLATIGGRWWGLVARADACWLGAALAWCGTMESGNDKAPGRDSIGRLALMPHGYRNGRRQLDPTRGKPDLVRSSRRLDALAGVLVSELIR